MTSVDNARKHIMMQKLLSSSTFIKIPSTEYEHKPHVHGPHCNHGHDHADYHDDSSSPAESVKAGTVGE